MSWLKGALLGALALAACGRGGGAGQHALTAGKPGADPAPDPTPVTTPLSSPGDCPDGVKIRIIGTHQGGVASLVLTPALAGVTCSFAPVCGNRDEAQNPIDLSTDAEAHDLATFNYPPAGFPPPGQPMTLGVWFAGGSARVGDGAGPVTTCGNAVSIVFDPRRIDRDRCSVTILLDVERSLVPTDGGFDLVPQYRIYF